MKSNNTKRALMLSCLSLLLCMSMLVGSTFAWFTDTATTGVNKIQAGELDIDFMVKNANGTWEDATTYGNLSFTNVKGETEILWEPGATFALPAVKLVNNGNLALKFNLFVNGLTGDMALAEVLEVIINGTALTNADGSAVTLSDLMADADGLAHGVLLPAGKTLPEGADSNYVKIGETGEYKIALHMAEEAGNEYQGLEISGMSLTAYATQYTYENDTTDNTYDEDAIYATTLVSSIDEFKAALALAKKGDVIGFTAGEYDFNNETVVIDESIGIVGSGNQETVLKNVIFDVYGADSYVGVNSDVTFENLKFEGVSRIIVGTDSDTIGGQNYNAVGSLTVRNCYAKTTFVTDPLKAQGGKGQFIYLRATYSFATDLTLVGNTFINAHTIEGEDASPVVNGNGTVIRNAYIANNTFGDAENPCDRYAVKFARRMDSTNIVINNNTVYGATTADKDFYILDLWQSGSTAYAGLNVSVNGNDIICTPNEGRAVYGAYIESTVKGTDIDITSDVAILDNSVKQ